jgi:hypothetical protein
LSAIYDWPDANSDEEDSDVNQVRNEVYVVYLHFKSFCICL